MGSKLGSSRAGFGGAGAGRFLRFDFGVPTVLELGVDALELSVCRSLAMLVVVVADGGGGVAVWNNSLASGVGGAGALRDLRERIVPPAEEVRELLEPRASVLRCRLCGVLPSELKLP